MIMSIRIIAVSLFACASVVAAGCNTGTSPADEEPVVDAKQGVITTGYYRTYFTDRTYSEAVGWENYDCSPQYRTLDGEKTNFYKQTRYDCPGFDDPALPEDACYQCNPTLVNGKIVNICSATMCP